MKSKPPLNDPDLIETLKMAHQLGQRWSTDEDFQKIHADDKDFAERQMSDGGLPGNMFIIHGHLRDEDPTRTDQRVLMPVVFADWPPPEIMHGQPFGKLGAMRGIAHKWVEEFPDHMPAVVSHIAEVWIAKHDEKKEMSPGWSPSVDPNRIEVVIVATVSVDQRISHSYRTIVRDANEKFLRLGDDSGLAYVPGKPVDPRTIFDHSVMFFFSGYFEARGIK